MIRQRPVRCAIYTRQSVSSEDALSSCQVQYDVCRAYIESQGVLGWITVDERFDDEGASGATLNRPALQRLLGLVRERGVDQVVVHRFDRLARSLIGYVRLLEEFRKHRVSLFIVTAPETWVHRARPPDLQYPRASFAEFEREMIAFRIADARAALRRRGAALPARFPTATTATPGRNSWS